MATAPPALYPLSPVALPDATTPVVVQLPAGDVTAVKVANESPYYLKVSAPGNSDSWVSAWSVDVVPLTGSASSLTLTPTLIGSSVNAPSAEVVLTLATGGDQIPGTYPAPLPRQMSIAAGSVDITTGSVSISGTVPVSNPGGTSFGVSGNVPVQNVTGGSLQQYMAITNLGTISAPTAGVEVVTNFTIPAGTKALALFHGNPAQVQRIRVYDPATAAVFLNVFYLAPNPTLQNQGVIFANLPVAPQSGQLAVGLTNNANSGSTLLVSAHNQAVTDFLDTFPLPWLAPNQLPAVVPGLANTGTSNTCQLVAEAANVTLWVFDFDISFISGGGSADLWAGTSGNPLQTRLLSGIQPSSGLIRLGGSHVTAGLGLYVAAVAGSTIWSNCMYSKS